MQAVYFTGNRRTELREAPDPAPGPDEVVLEIQASGICGTDLHTYRSETGSPCIIGHEPCGVVAARGTGVDPRLAPEGARVMVHHYDGCRTCRECLAGWTQLCERGSIVYGRTGDGAHARWMKVPARTLVPLPDALSFVAGAAVSCGTGTAYGALKRMGLQGGETLAVFGQGPVGQSATMIGVAMGARVIAVDIDRARLQGARAFGADEVVDASAGEASERVRELTSGRGTAYALECSGKADAVNQALRATRRWGTVCLVGMGGRPVVNVTDDIIRGQLTVLGSWTFSTVGQADCAEFCVAHALPVEDLFTHRFRLAEAPRAYAMFDKRETGKAVILPN
jgi:(R,R)-butanediol dehydrogenase / meso-butanediol dehydrogenase / diacetyl reductase